MKKKNLFKNLFKGGEKQKCREKDIKDIQKQIDNLTRESEAFIEMIHNGDIEPGSDQWEPTIQALESWSRQVKELRAEQARLVYGADEHDHTDAWIRGGAMVFCTLLIIGDHIIVGDHERSEGILLNPKLLRFNAIPKI